MAKLNRRRGRGGSSGPMWRLAFPGNAGRFALALGLLFVGFAAEISFAQSPDPKVEAAKLLPGAYYWTGMNWQAMEPLEWSANGLKKKGKSSVWIYRHSEARVQLRDATPLFCYKVPQGASASATPAYFHDLVIARLDRKKDHRELETSPGSGAFAFNAGLTKQFKRETAVTDVAPDVFFVAPKEPLSPGEYVIGGSSLAISGYDFGVRSLE